MNVPFVDLNAQHQPLRGELLGAFARLIDSASFIAGPEVKAFEEAFAQYLGAKHCIAVSSGTAALHLALLGLGIGPGDEVITVSHTFIATVEAITAVGAHPILVDVDPAFYTLDPRCLDAAITPRTKAIIPVHLYGQPADMSPILETARQRGLAVVEDACQAHGARYGAQKVGSLAAAAGCFSFFPSKNLGCCGEGGAIVTNDAALARRARLLRAHGSQRKYEHHFPGFNLRMEELQGAVLRAKLGHLDSWNNQRRAIADIYTRMLAGSGVLPPAVAPYAEHVYHLYVIQSEQRDRLREYVTARGIETGLHYPVPVHLQEAYRSLGYREGDLPVTEQLVSRILSLPMYPDMTAEAAEYVASNIIECCHALTQLHEAPPIALARKA